MQEKERKVLIDLEKAPKTILFFIGEKLLEEPKTLFNFLSCNKKTWKMAPLFWEQLIRKHFKEDWKEGLEKEEFKKLFLEFYTIKPKWFADLCKALINHKTFLQTEGIFRVSASLVALTELQKEISEKKKTEEIVNCFLKEDSHTIAFYLKDMFRGDTEFPIPFDPLEFAEKENKISYLKEQIAKKKPSRRRKLKAFLDLLFEISKNTDFNLMSLRNLSIVCNYLLLHTNKLDFQQMLTHNDKYLQATDILLENKEICFSL